MISNTGYHCCCPVMTLSLSLSLSLTPPLTLPVPIPLSLVRCSLSIYSHLPTGYWMVVVPPDLHKIINRLYPKERHTRRTITFHYYYYYYPHPSLYTHTSSNRHEPSEAIIHCPRRRVMMMPRIENRIAMVSYPSAALLNWRIACLPLLGLLSGRSSRLGVEGVIEWLTGYKYVACVSFRLLFNIDQFENWLSAIDDDGNNKRTFYILCGGVIHSQGVLH